MGIFGFDGRLGGGGGKRRKPKKSAGSPPPSKPATGQPKGKNKGKGK